MNRQVTNAIRWTMDNCVPAVPRDSRAFRYPFYRFAYGIDRDDGLPDVALDPSSPR